MSLPVWVSTDAPYCRPDESVREAMRKMSRWDSESLPVCEDDRKLLGTISMRAVCLYADVSGKRVAGIRVREVLEPETLACIADDRARDVMRRMSESRQWCLPVIDRNHALIGMVRFRALQRNVEGESGALRIIDAGADSAAGAGTHAHPEADFRGWTVNAPSLELVSPTGERRHLSRSELRLLLVLARSAGRVAKRDALTLEVCNRVWEPTDRYIDVLIGNLRGKFGERASGARVIVTVQNEGYMLTLRVESTANGSGVPSPGTQPHIAPEPLAVSAATGTDTGVYDEEVGRIYEQQGETDAQNHCMDRRLIASICMSCNRMYRVVDSRGSTGGLSHGWCSARCAEQGAAWAGADVTLPSPSP